MYTFDTCTQIRPMLHVYIRHMHSDTSHAACIHSAHALRYVPCCMYTFGTCTQIRPMLLLYIRHMYSDTSHAACIHSAHALRYVPCCFCTFGTCTQIYFAKDNKLLFLAKNSGNKKLMSVRCQATHPTVTDTGAVHIQP